MRIALLVLGILLCLVGAAVAYVGWIFYDLETALGITPPPHLAIISWQLGVGVVVVGLLVIVGSRLIKRTPAASRS